MFLSNKRIRFKRLLIAISLSFLFLYALNPEFFTTIYENWKFNDEIGTDTENLKISKISDKIHIDNNWTDAKNAGICTGSGTYSDPYVIKDLMIDGGGSGSCILIENSNEYSKIENCTVYNSGMGWDFAGIKLNKVNNGTVINNNCSFNGGNGIQIKGWCSTNNTISGNNITNNGQSGIKFESNCNNNTISRNTIKNNYYGIFLSGDNNNVSQNTLNNNQYGGGIYLDGNKNIVSENTLNNNLHNGICLYGNNNTILNNNITNSPNGIELYGCKNNNFTRNLLNLCGFSIYGSLEETSSHSIDVSNLVNGKPIYYYANETSLEAINFTDAGQVILVNCNKSLISNVNVLNSSNGIILFYCNNNTISGNNLNNNRYMGIRLNYCYNNTISGNIVNYNENSGIFIVSSYSNTISGNTANNNMRGIFLDCSDNNTIMGNTANNNFGDLGGMEYSGNGINIWNSHNNTFSKNTANYNDYNGIFLGRMWVTDEINNNNIISGNNVSLNHKNGIYLGHSNNTIISQNTANNNRDGIFLDYSNNTLISHNSINYNNYQGIILENSNYNNITQNNVDNNNLGINLFNCCYNNISANSINSNTGEGMYIGDNSNNNKILGNNISYNNQMGISLKGNDNKVSGNNINENYYGIHLLGNNITVSGNNLKNNRYCGIYLRRFLHWPLFFLSNYCIISGNNISSSKYGIYLTGSYHNISKNLMNECGIYTHGSFENLSSYSIDTANLVNNKPLYYYVNKTNLGQDNFLNAGQVILVNCNDSLISNLDVSYGTCGISLHFCRNNIVSNNNASHNSYYGINLRFCNNCIISDNYVSNNGDYGIILFGNNNSISENNVSHNFGGILIGYNSNNNTILGNNASYNDYGILLDYSNNNTISENILKNNNYYGINLNNNNNNTITRNLMNNCGLIISGSLDELASHHVDTTNLVNNKPLYYYINEIGLEPNDFLNAGQIILINVKNSLISGLDVSYGSCGISLYYCIDNIVLGNSANNNSKDGIYIEYSDNNVVLENIANNNSEAGIHLSNCNHNNLEGNFANNNRDGIILRVSNNNYLLENNANDNKFSGIYLHHCSYNTIIRNTIDKIRGSEYHHIMGLSGYGIYLISSVYNNVSENNISYNNNIGIYLSHCDFNTFSGNIISFNEQIGILIVESHSLSESNCFYKNYFNGNKLHAEDNGINNTWDNGSLGNFWDDYIGADTNDDGIGDYPYLINGTANSYDYFPIWDDGDDLPPIIKINSPTENTKIGGDAPDFNIEIIEPNLDTLWYTLDGSLTNIIFTTNGTIDQTLWENLWDPLSDGDSITILFYANDTFGKLASKDVKVIKDDYPKITIISPLNNEEFDRNAPSFIIEINETDLDTLWYTIDGGMTNKTFTTNGTIDQTLWENLWDTLSDGDSIMIRFYANDTLGQIGYCEVIVLKNVPEESEEHSEEGFIQGYDLLIFISCIFAISIILIKKRSKI